ncbi:hypothetical protein BFW01_g10816 [Lasiodiplodia theobromae]|uniref:Uncharacterized protein n=2 Tax=Lasiodiplodia theobromae TaxID=45133 RepID=A0A8H7IPK6_9PEZI|nr:hypothetical protein BFW01_g10816 [Lasiodiplodia theobromae]
MARDNKRKHAENNTLAVGAFLKHRNDKVWPTGSAKITPTSKEDDKGYIKSPAPAKQLNITKLRAAYAESPLRTFASKEARDLKNRVDSFNETASLREHIEKLEKENKKLDNDKKKLFNKNMTLSNENMTLYDENMMLYNENKWLRQKLEALGIPEEDLEEGPEEIPFIKKRRLD